MKMIYPTFDQFLNREKKELRLGQKGIVYWLYGPSGSGKTTIAVALEELLHTSGKFVVVLDGDNLRSGVNAGLGFSQEDRMENIRRAAEIAKILAQNGVVVICSFVCPLRAMRSMARTIIGSDFREIYIQTSITELIRRDTKGFYKKQLEEGKDIMGFNGDFEEPESAELILSTEKLSPIEGAKIVIQL